MSRALALTQKAEVMEKKITEKAKKAFLTELTWLSRKHGITIAGCGCCGSPWLASLREASGHYKADDGKEIRWVDPK